MEIDLKNWVPNDEGGESLWIDGREAFKRWENPPAEVMARYYESKWRLHAASEHSMVFQVGYVDPDDDLDDVLAAFIPVMRPVVKMAPLGVQAISVELHYVSEVA